MLDSEEIKGKNILRSMIILRLAGISNYCSQTFIWKDTGMKSLKTITIKLDQTVKG